MLAFTIFVHFHGLRKISFFTVQWSDECLDHFPLHTKRFFFEFRKIVVSMTFGVFLNYIRYVNGHSVNIRLNWGDNMLRMTST